MPCHSLGIPPTGHQTAPSGSVHARALAACPQGPCCLRPGACQRAHASMPQPWPRCLGCCMHAQALAAACPWGAALALAAACPGLGCLPMGAALALAAACPGLGSMPMGGCWAGSGHPRGMPACTPRRIAPHRPALRQNWLVPFSIFVSLNSFHDFRGGFQQAVRRSERF